MSDNHQVANRTAQYLCEALFSLHLSFATMSLLFVVSSPVLRLFSQLEWHLNELFHIRNTDFVRGYWAMWVSSILLGFLIWSLLHAVKYVCYSQDFAPVLTGLITILIPLPFWSIFYKYMPWPVYWPNWGSVLEMAAALGCTLLYLAKRSRVPCWAGLLLIAVHYAFWYLVPGSARPMPNYAGPTGPILGVFAASTWWLYVTRLRNVSADRET